jgi:hypothetical protein
MDRADFYLGTHIPSWAWTMKIPLCISHARLRERKTLRETAGRWMLDSGSYSMLSQNHMYIETPIYYIKRARYYANYMGMPDFMAPQDWMCEPWMIRRTGLSIHKHQENTVNNYLELRYRANDLPWIPVIQGYTINDYLKCRDDYEQAGIDLLSEPLVGVGSICRRQNTYEVLNIVQTLYPLKMHGFGVSEGLSKFSKYLVTADSMAWSQKARYYEICLPGHTHLNCANCPEYAIKWRGELLSCVN